MFFLRTCALLSLLLLLPGCGALNLDDPITIIFIDDRLGDIGPRARRALELVLAQLQTRAIGMDVQRVTIKADPFTDKDGYIKSSDRSTMYLAPQWIKAYPDADTNDLHLKVLVAHELGHMLGQDKHLPCDGNQNVMAQNCLPSFALYSDRDIQFICQAAKGGICATLPQR